MGSTILIVLTLWVGLACVIYFIWQQMWVRETSERRLGERFDEPDTRPIRNTRSEHDFFTRWLISAGFRSSSAPVIFIFSTLICGVIGGLVGFWLDRSGVIQRAQITASMIPGGFGDLVNPFIITLPYVTLAMFACLPLVMVRTARARRVVQVEQDLPVTMELLATLCEAGLGFDSAIERILSSLGKTRPLVTEFRIFRIESLSGRSRVACFRRLAHRVDVASFTVFISAVVQAEQIGSGIATVLRRQADDLRDRRRERAMEFVMSRPVKLLFPMVIGFLPGIFLWALGPTFYQILQFFSKFSVSGGF